MRQNTRTRTTQTSLSVFSIALCTGMVFAGDHSAVDPDFGFDFVTIGDPGNRDTTLEETAGPFGYPGDHVGGVEYEYRIAMTEVTTAEYFEFVVAYFPIFMKGNTLPGWPPFTGRWISISSGSPEITQAYANSPAAMGWEFAARYVNWLHNGKVNEEWAFETGVYDTSTFTINDDGTFNHQESHHSEARYWIPTRDEWTKAAYWDPNKDAGKGGYWRYPNTSDIESIPELLPQDGGERNAGLVSEGWPLAVGSFPTVLSPWGIPDMAGGVAEHAETAYWDNFLPQRWWLGSDYLDTSYGRQTSNDLLGKGGVLDSCSGGLLQGLRLASTVRHPADLNQDWHVNFFDVSFFMRHYLEGDLAVDFNEDNQLDINDVLEFLKLLGQ